MKETEIGRGKRSGVSEGDGQGQAEEGQRAWPEISGDQIKCGQREEIQHGSGQRQEVLGDGGQREKPGEAVVRGRKSWVKAVRGSHGQGWSEGGGQRREPREEVGRAHRRSPSL